jgi:cytosine/adenosine deaminase-related metal-dependent hydrolase
MRLNNLLFPDDEGLYDLWIQDGKITAIQPSQSADPVTDPSPGLTPPTSPLAPTGKLSPDFHGNLDLRGALVFPGLINSHDHLDFNLFPHLGNRFYKNYTEWGPDIHANNSAAIKPILRVPKELRTLWGIYKNLLNGFTTVVNHGDKLATDNNLITVFQDCYCLHSVGFEPRWKWKLNRPRLNWLKPDHRGRKDAPFALHVGEGTNPAAGKEIDQLIRWNLFRRPLIGIHGVAMTEQQASAFRALVWCPASNYFLLDRTAPIDKLKAKVPILFGTDSTLTADWNHWSHIRMARNLLLATDHELLDMLTSAPAHAWGLTACGALTAGLRADLVVARGRPGLTGMDAFYELNPEDLLLVLHEGNIRLFDPSLLEPISAADLPAGDLRQTKPGGKYVSGDLPGLMQEIRRHCPEIQFPVLP